MIEKSTFKVRAHKERGELCLGQSTKHAFTVTVGDGCLFDLGLKLEIGRIWSCLRELFGHSAEFMHSSGKSTSLCSSRGTLATFLTVFFWIHHSLTASFRAWRKLGGERGSIHGADGTPGCCYSQ